jgi:hypothetical protein
MNTEIFHTVSISGRYVYGYLCLRAVITQQGLEQMPDLLDRFLKIFIETNRKDLWDEQARQFLPSFVLTDDNGIPFSFDDDEEEEKLPIAYYYHSLTPLFRDVLEELIELGRVNLYGSFESNITFYHINNIVTLLQENNIDLPDIKIVDRFPVSEFDGWGNAISFSSLDLD